MMDYIHEWTRAAQAMNHAQLESLANHLLSLKTMGNTLFVCGNGGSFSVAQHWGVDLTKQAGMKVHVLGSNPAYMTAIANDLDYMVGLSTEFTRWARRKDTVVCLSCSGKSRNIVSVLNEAKKASIRAYLVTGVRAPEYSEVTTIRVESIDYGVLEDVFGTIGHWLTRQLV